MIRTLLAFLFIFAAHSVFAEQTLSIIKPNGVASHHIGDIISRFEKQDLRIAALKMTKLSQEDAERFYAVHKDRPFFKELVASMTVGPIVVRALEGDNAVAKNREIMGATDPQKAAKGTIRADFGESITKNTVHGYDSVESAKTEISFFSNPLISIETDILEALILN